jgi:hypothetical protein
MSDSNASTGTLNNLLKTFFTLQALATLKEDCVMKEMVSPENIVPLPYGEGTTVKWNAWRRIAPASTTLDEASGNASLALSSRLVSATIVSRGRAVKYTDLVEKTAVLNVKQGGLDMLLQSAALTYDNQCQYAWFKPDISQCGVDGAYTASRLLSVFGSATFSSYCANTGTNATSNKQFGFPCVHAASSTHLSGVGATAPSTSAQAGPFGIRKGLARIKHFGSQPFADGKYRGAMHTYAHRDMMGNPDWQRWFVNYESGPKETMQKNEITPLHGIRFFVSQNMPRYAIAGGRTVNPILIVGREACGITELKGDNGDTIQFIITEPGPQSTNDPFHLNSYVTYKIRMAAAVLNPSAGVIVMTHEKL